MTIRVEHSEIIYCPIETVWHFTTDTNRLTEWQSGLLSARDVDPTIGVGGHHIQLRKIIGRDLETEFEVTEWEPPYRLALRTVRGPIPYEVVQIYERLDEGTRFTIIVEGEPGGYFAVAAPLVVNQLKHDFEADFKRLKEILEAW